METSMDTEPFSPLNELLTSSISSLRKIADQDECIHVWEGDDCMLCDLHMEF